MEEDDGGHSRGGDFIKTAWSHGVEMSMEDSFARGLEC